MEVIVAKNCFCFDPFHLMTSEDIIRIIQNCAYNDYDKTNYDDNLWLDRMLFTLKKLIQRWCIIRDEQHPEWTWKDFTYFIAGYKLKDTVIQNNNDKLFKEIMGFQEEHIISIEFINHFFERTYSYYGLYYKKFFEWNVVCSGLCIPNKGVTKIMFYNDIDMTNSYMFSFLELYCKNNNIILEKKDV